VHLPKSNTTTCIWEAKPILRPHSFPCFAAPELHLDASAADHAASGALWRSSMEPPAMLIPCLVVIPSLGLHSVQPSAVFVTCVLCSAVTRGMCELLCQTKCYLEDVYVIHHVVREPPTSRRSPLLMVMCSAAASWKKLRPGPAAGLPLSPQRSNCAVGKSNRCGGSWAQSDARGESPVHLFVRQSQSLSLLLCVQARPRSS
jgi:hypothetical protein